MRSKNLFRCLLVACVASILPPMALATVDQAPLYTTRAVMPLNMLVMGRDHKLYFEAYNDASDLDGDGAIDIRFKPSINYYGYFDSAKCYSYTNGRYEPTDKAAEGTWTDPATNTLKTTIGICSAKTGRWSGNYLNYLTTSRIDALRKVLYGGKRSLDAASDSSGTGQTVLERSSIPQDGHSWGKEYTSLAVDRYLITDYTPLAQPIPGFRHLFANLTLGESSATSANSPLLRVLLNSNYRIWEWVSIEEPVGGDHCINQSTNCVHGTYTDAVHPTTASEFTSLISRVSPNLLTDPAGISRSYINKIANGALALPGSTAEAGKQDSYVTVIKGNLVITTPGTYDFAVNGDDAVEVLIDGAVIVGYYGGHGDGNYSDHHATLSLSAGVHTLEFHHEEVDGGDHYALAWKTPNGSANWTVIPAGVSSNSRVAGVADLLLWVYGRDMPASTLTDFTVRNLVCVAPDLLEDNCKSYTSVSGTRTYTTWKPTGLLQDYGYATTGNPKMKFGLLTGSYANNIRGGVIRRLITNISDELIGTTGQFSSVNGIIGTIDKLKVVGFQSNYNYSCGRNTASAISNGECTMWGNPIAEMMYEGLRYFAGKTTPTSIFQYSKTNSNIDDNKLGLPEVTTWVDPYKQEGSQSCSAPIETVISDINPSYDTDDLPGANWSDSAFAGGDISGLDVGALGTTIWNSEYRGKLNIFIGETGGVVDTAPRAKDAYTLKDTRGLAPEEPTKMGGYYAASVAYYGRTHQLNPLSNQNLTTYSVALASPLPQIKIPVGGGFVTLIPFAKSIGGNGISAAATAFQPTNAVVDFYIESMAADGTSGTFRVNYEDTEQGADYDMDAISRYTYSVGVNNTVTVTMSSDYAAGGIVQHMGYIISGTTKDGVYLEVRDSDTPVGSTSDSPYYLDTPPGFWVGDPAANRGTAQLPLFATRTFTASGNAGAQLLKNPLWYAAKYGGFTDSNNNGLPDATVKSEWTSSSANDPDPDNYFLVTNALGLRSQLDKAFSNILKQLSSNSAVAVSGGEASAALRVIQASFRSEDWSGEVLAYGINTTTFSVNDTPEWNAASLMPAATDRNIYTWQTDHGVSFKWTNLNAVQQGYLKRTLTGTSTESDATGQARVDYLRGDQSNEQTRNLTGTMRYRGNGVLGDIVNSGPVYVDNVVSALTTVPSTDAATYTAYRNSLLNTRPEMVYAGSNDGMLHAFCAVNCGAIVPGKEVFAYVPNSIMPDMFKLTIPNYAHEYFVDGPTTVSDALIGSAWKTILVGSTGAGGAGIYALDVSSPTSFNAAKVMWEFTPATEQAAISGPTDLGYTIGKPQIGRVKVSGTATSVAIFSNGFEGQSGRASLYVVNLQTGALIKRLQVPASYGGSNGLAAPALLDSDKDGYIDFVYAGDQQGNLWRFNIGDATTPDNWTVGINGLPLLQARSPAGAVQPFSIQPLISQVYSGGQVMIYLGTGRYLSTSDKTDLTPQAFYAVQDSWLGDTSSHTAALTKNNLQMQAVSRILVNGVLRTAVTLNPVNYTTQAGWYLPLEVPTTGGATRVVVQATFVGSLVRIVALTPSIDSCSYGGTSPSYDLDALSGTRRDATKVVIGGVNYVLSGSVSDSIQSAPTLIGANGGIVSYTSNTKNEIGMTQTASSKRLSWREIVE